MKINPIHNAMRYAAALCLCLALLSCERNRTVEDTEEITVDTAEREDTARVVRTGKTAEDRLEELRGWMNEKSGSADTAIRRDWPEVKEKFRQRTAELDEDIDSLSAESKEEYNQLKSRYQRWEERQERRQQTPLDKAKLTQWQEQLLREYKDINKISPQNIREAYLTFMGVVRAKRQKWTQSDWDYVDYVYGQLNQRRGEIEGQIASGDNLKIRSLQAEYLTLEGSADAGSLMRDLRK
ncbi:hypothetical protein [Pontibacter ruber]|uniref:DUF349 domain-containing protein n=1 Tax=Pontibacter ruber TaxID=1343895 RepID=A0ABW5CV63_9BACT|nr:hypothetical protein [Pontibacter ruber]